MFQLNELNIQGELDIKTTLDYEFWALKSRQLKVAKIEKYLVKELTKTRKIQLHIST